MTSITVKSATYFVDENTFTPKLLLKLVVNLERLTDDRALMKPEEFDLALGIALRQGVDEYIKNRDKGVDTVN